MGWYDSSSGRVGIVMKKRARFESQEVNQNDYLMHFGILGQKWGVRRFQKEDGSLTEEGKRRYGQSPESETWKRSEAEHLSDEELRRRNNRLQAERQYKDLTTSQVERERAQRRKEIINKVIIGTGVSLAAVAMRGHWKNAASFIGKIAKRKFAPYKAASMLKNTLNKSNVPFREAYPVKETLGKHVGRISKKMMTSGGPKIYDKGVYSNPLLKNKAYWRGLGRI